jgi:hypothetical protein
MDKTPIIVDKLLKDAELEKLQKYFKNTYKKYSFEKKCSRYITDSNNDEVLKQFLHSNLDIVRKIFNNNKLLPTIAFFSHYEGNGKLKKHKDGAGGTHTFDTCIYQTEPWDIYVEGMPYTLQENQSLAFYGEDQLHWREKFPNPESQHVAVIFCHYAEPDHWMFKHK